MKNKGEMSLLITIAIFIIMVIFVITFFDVIGTSVAYSCKGATTSLITDIETLAQSFDNNVASGRSLLEDEPTELPACISCIKEDGNDLIFTVEDSELKLEGKEKYNYIYNNGQVPKDCSFKGGDKYIISISRDSPSDDIEIRFQRETSP